MTKRAILIVFAITALAAASHAQAKAELVRQLVQLTYKSHPTISTEERSATLPKDPQTTSITKESNAGIITTALESNKGLTPDQKTFVTAHIDDISKMIDEKMAAIRDKRYDFDGWIKEGLKASYTAKYTTVELKTAVAYFNGQDGKQTLNFLRLEVIERLMAAGPKAGEYKVEYTPQDRASYQNYKTTAAGKKFLKIFLDDTEAYVNERSKKAFEAMWADTFAVLDEAEINKMIDKFVAERYKK